MEMVDQLGIGDHVKFVDKYLQRTKSYITFSCPISTTPYLGKEQAVSGTLAYAVGYGKVIVSTPYSYAQEMLAEGRGFWQSSGTSDSLAKHIMYVLDNPQAKRRWRRGTLSVGRTMMWRNVASHYTKLLH